MIMIHDGRVDSRYVDSRVRCVRGGWSVRRTSDSKDMAGTLKIWRESRKIWRELVYDGCQR